LRRWRLAPGKLSRKEILQSLLGRRQKSGGKPQEDSKEILWNQEVYQEAERHP
jgi:hypothetical protein